MKKLFFFKSSPSNNKTNNLASTQSKEKLLRLENLAGESAREPRSKTAAPGNQTGPRLRKSRSYSAGTVDESGLLTSQNESPFSSSTNHSPGQSDCCSQRAEKHSRAKWSKQAAVCSAPGVEKFFSISFSGADNASSEISTSKVVDRYVVGELHQESGPNPGSPMGAPNRGGNRPPRVQNAAEPDDGGAKRRPWVQHTSPNGDLARKPRYHSFKNPNKGSKLFGHTRDWVENGTTAHESPKKLVKQVVERLSRFRVNSKEFEPDVPITIDDVHGGSHKRLESCHGLTDDDCTRVLDCDYNEPEDAHELMIELDSQTRKLEKEKNELQFALEKGLARRSTEWSMKLERLQTEEHSLRERTRELAEQNVSLQKEVSLLKERGSDHQSRLVHSGQKLMDLTSKMENLTEENRKLQQNLAELHETYKSAEEERDCFRRNYEDKENECKELHKAVTRLLRTRNEQEKTIDGLCEGLKMEVRKMGLSENSGFDHNGCSNLHIEHLRLTGVEQVLRKEAESYRMEVDSLRHENINLLHRLKGGSMDGGFSSFKLDQELWSLVHCLQSRGLCLIDESVQLCSKLLENVKKSACRSSFEARQGDEEALQNGLDGQFIVESDVKLQGFKRGAESLTRSLQTVSDVLLDKSRAATPDNECSKDAVKSDLKAEALITSLLREKLCSKLADVEQLEAELASAVRGNDILRCEVQNAMDALSCATHKMKDLEIQLIKKDEAVFRLQNELQDCRKEVAFVNGILPKVSDERDMMWEEVKRYSESNMLLGSEVDELKRKLEALDEDVLVKEGQIAILKDALGKPFDLLSSPRESLLL